MMTILVKMLKEKTNQLKKVKYSFQPGHPQYQIHHVHIDTLPRLSNFIPNTLPRPDCGDREYYCYTMLTFSNLGEHVLISKQDRFLG
jgi:hypothetical protein